MRCLFVRSPFAKWIVSRVDGLDTGVKFLEYRTRPTNIRGRIGIIQSGTNTVIGDVEIVGCHFSFDLRLFMWAFVCPRRYVKPVPFTARRGAIVWTNVDYDPDAQKIMDAISKEDAERENIEYSKALDAWLKSNSFFTTPTSNLTHPPMQG